MLDGTSRIRDSKGKSIRHGNFVSGFSDYTVVPEGALIPVDKAIPLDQAALMSCCVPTGWGTVTKLANVQPGDAVAVWGIGGVGQNALRAAKVRGAFPLIAVDLEEARREKAMKLGADYFINSSKEDPVPIVQETHRRWARLRLRGERRSRCHGAVLVGIAGRRKDHVHRHHG